MGTVLAIIGAALFAGIKFLFSAAPAFAITKSSVLVSAIITPGGLLGVAVFYFSAGALMRRAAKKREEKRELLLAEGKEIKQKKAFTRINKFMVKMKMNPWGLYLIAFVSPVIISIPIGSVIAAKFYGESKKTPFVLAAGVLFWGIVLPIAHIPIIPGAYFI